MIKKCKECGTVLDPISDTGWMICDNENCPTYSKGWDRLVDEEAEE